MTQPRGSRGPERPPTPVARLAAQLTVSLVTAVWETQMWSTPR